jgi:hypothetical protein
VSRVALGKRAAPVGRSGLSIRVRALLSEGRTVREVALGLGLPEDLVWAFIRAEVRCPMPSGRARDGARPGRRRDEGGFGAGAGGIGQPERLVCRTCPMTAACGVD